MATETKYEKFVRLAEKRVPKMTEAMRLVSQLSSANYEQTPEALEALKGVFDENTTNLYDAFDLQLPGPAQATTQPSPQPSVQASVEPSQPVGTAPPVRGEDIFDGPNYDLPEWKVIKEAYDLLCNLTSQDDLDKATRLIKKAIKA